MNFYNIVQLTDIDLSKLKLMKETYQWFGDQDHSRWVFQSKKGLFFKIWNPTYIRRDNLLRGIECGFFDETTVPAFHAVIYAKGICRGYVMQKCLPNRRRDPVLHAYVLEKTAQTGFFCVQYSRFHTMRYGEKFSLVDLEAIHPLKDLPCMSSFYHCFFDDWEYECFVTNLYCRAFPDLEMPQPTKRLNTSGYLPRQNFYPIRKTQSLIQDFYRRMIIRMGTFFNHIERIEY